ncbi:MAG TPA: ATP-binding protein [Longimicrobiales bacterium]
MSVRLRDLPLRTKLVITAIGATMLLLSVATYVSFSYWKDEAVRAAGQQALLGAASARAAVESALVYGQGDQARANLKRLRASGSVLWARVYAPDGTVLFSSDGYEEGRRFVGVWVPAPAELPEKGETSLAANGESVRAFLPVGTPRAAVIEVAFSVQPVEAAIDRGARFSLGLLIGSLLAFVAIVFVLLEREVVVPLGRVARAATQAAGLDERGEDELGALRVSLAELIEQEAQAQRAATLHRQEMERQAGLAQVGEIAAEMAHEFKRPLASVRIAMELLAGHVRDARGRELLRTVDQQLDRLTETMRDLFALAHPEALQFSAVDVRDVVDEALMQLSQHAGAAVVDFRKEYDPEALTIWGDHRRLTQVALNLIGNALEAMEGGGVLTVRTRRLAEAVELSVEDTGPGIAPGDVDRVLRPFYSTKERGTGLGLPLVARIVCAHGGQLAIEGEPGRGTTVRLVFPDPTVSKEAEVASWQTPESSSSTTIG